jgi:hypothetical protein
MKHLSSFIFALSVCFPLFSPPSAAQQKPQGSQTHGGVIEKRTVYWLHDVNEDIPPINTSYRPDAQSTYWKGYAGEGQPPMMCAPVDAATLTNSYFRATRQMEPKIINYFSDPFVPQSFNVLAPPPVGQPVRPSFYHTPGLTRPTTGGSKNFTQLADSISNVIQLPPGTPTTPDKLPIALGHGAGTNLIRSIEQFDRTNNKTSFGAVIGIGSMNDGLDIIKSIENGKITSFDVKMRDAMNGGYTKLIDASSDKILGLFIGLLFKGLTEEIAKGIGGDLPRETARQAQKLFTKGMKGIIGTTGAVGFGLDFIPFDEQPSGAGTLLTDFHAYTAGMYNSKAANNASRPLTSDLKTKSPFIEQQKMYTSSSALPSITLNGTVKKPYFEAALHAMPMNHTQYKCVDDFKDKSAEELQTQFTAEYARMKTEGPLIYGGVVAAVTAIKVAISIATKDPWGIASAAYGVVSSMPKYFEISEKFGKGEKWLKQEADFGWSEVIGAYRDEEYQVTVLRDPCGTTLISNPDCDSPLEEVTVTRTRRIITPSDGIVRVESQRNPREANWTPAATANANTDTELNLEVKGANHFSQANHPQVRRQLNRVFNGDFTTNTQLQQAFRVGR